MLVIYLCHFLKDVQKVSSTFFHPPQWEKDPGLCVCVCVCVCWGGGGGGDAG